MRVLCIADNIDPLVYSSNIKERFGDVQLVLSAGDLPLSYYDFIVSSLNKPLVFVFGNHHLKYFNAFGGRSHKSQFDWSEYENQNLGGFTYTGWKITKINGLLIAGFGGSKRYNNEENQYTEWRMKTKMLRVLPHLFWNRLVHGRYIDIVLTHAPAKGIGDGEDRCHSGFESYLWFMRKFKPKFLIHGHIHLYDQNSTRIYNYNDTTVVNAYNHVVIEV